jgi:hypothetical protein
MEQVLRTHFETINAFAAAQNEANRLAILLREQATELHAQRHAQAQKAPAKQNTRRETDTLGIVVDHESSHLEASVVPLIIDRLAALGRKAAKLSDMSETPRRVLYLVSTPTGRLEGNYDAGKVRALEDEFGAGNVMLQSVQFGGNADAFAFSNSIVYHLEGNKYRLIETRALPEALAHIASV